MEGLILAASERLNVEAGRLSVDARPHVGMATGCGAGRRTCVAAPGPPGSELCCSIHIQTTSKPLAVWWCLAEVRGEWLEQSGAACLRCCPVSSPPRRGALHGPAASAHCSWRRFRIVPWVLSSDGSGGGTRLFGFSAEEVVARDAGRTWS